MSLTQGRESVSQYALDFRILAVESGWDEVALQGIFTRGLSEEVKDELAARDETGSLEELISLAIRLDNRLRERRRERSGRQRAVFNPPNLLHGPQLTTSTPPSSGRVTTGGSGALSSSPASTEEPMQLGESRLSATERQRRLRLGLCIYCGQGGHRLATCPNLPKD